MPPPDLAISSSAPLANQVAGHDGVMSDASGSLVIKPALPREIAFYQMLTAAGREDPIYALKGFVPQSYGTLRLEGQLQPSGDVDTSVKDDVPESVVLENLSYAYTRPNIMDAKLGTVLFGPDANDEKRKRMDKQAHETTTHETGLRLTGCQTWHAPTGSYISTPKSFGKTITASQLPEGMVRFFPLPSDEIPSLAIPPSPPPTATSTSAGEATSSSEAAAHLLPPEPSTSSTQTADLPPTPVTAKPPSSTPSPPSYASHAIPPRLLFRILTLLLAELDRLAQVLGGLEMRFVGSSVLIVYEADGARLEAALDRAEERRAVRALRAASGEGEGEGEMDPMSRRSAFSDDGSSCSASFSEEEEDDESVEEDLDLDGVREDERRARKCPPLTVKMIDFAHTWLAEGEGPDEGVLKGLKTLRGLVEGRREEVEKAL
ncbi:hypothetical protein L198_07880 [Cryptococcus wingfieldii CBS 7118]|uniref:Kinase n=1 Tax=Cryptococcus wingfieldii CBS 7118 TaxID=1295528 RepID=A0A1E3HUT2_9TREE|nr:hypothetical protein L198_07880 [Cryptococcus wingfieldii CBS 7118]ODN80070.1 hypothetical protein L198_07880 [Cryptococcus wingfieldii CBS 7118]